MKRKARFIAQVMRGRLDVREIEDIGDAALSYNEVKALATGNPLLMDKAEADAELTRLQRAERACHRNQDALRYKITSTGWWIERLTALVGEVEAAIARRVDTRGDAFAMTIGGYQCDKRHEAGERLKQRLQRLFAMLGDAGRRDLVADRHGQLGGFDVISTGRKVLAATEIVVGLEGVPESTIRLGSSELNDIDPAKLIVRLENRLHGLEALTAKTSGEIDRLEVEASRAGEDLAKPFSLSQQLAEARDRVAEIERQLEEAARKSQRNDQTELTAASISGSDNAENPAQLAGPSRAEPPSRDQQIVTLARTGFPADALTDPAGAPMTMAAHRPPTTDRRLTPMPDRS